MSSSLPPLPGGLAPPADATPLSGGMIARVWRVRLADDRVVVVKQTNYDAQLEAEGLGALAEAGGPVPGVLAADHAVLVLEHVSGRPDWPGLGRALARVHRHTGASFGWHRDNVIGPLRQDNTPTASWPEFYAERRIAPYLDDENLPATVADRLRAALSGPLPALLDTDPAPSLVHGDLWAGNVIDGRFLIDPAVNHADRELELAFMALFGGFPDALWAAYEHELPLEAGWQRRRPALQLYHLLVHVSLFGGTYVRAVTARLDQLGW